MVSISYFYPNHISSSTKNFTAWGRYRCLMLKLWILSISISSSYSQNVTIVSENVTFNTHEVLSPTVASVSTTEKSDEPSLELPKWNLKCQNEICSVTYNSSASNVKWGLEWAEVIFTQYRTHPLYLIQSDLEQIMKVLGIIKSNKSLESEVDDHDHHDDPNDYYGSSEDYGYYNYVESSWCLKSAAGVLEEYFPNVVHEDIKISLSDFSLILPRLFYHLSSGECGGSDEADDDHNEDHDHGDHDSQEEKIKESRGKVWGITLGSVAVISLLSVIGIMILPLMSHTSQFQRLLSFLVALAVGTLVGDALLHLLPHAMGGHEDGHSHSGDDGAEEKNKIVKSLVAIIGVYIFFVFESCMCMIRKLRERRRYKAALKSVPKLEVESPKSDQFLMAKAEEAIEEDHLLNTPNSSSSPTPREDSIVKSTDSGISTSNINYGIPSHSNSKATKPLGNGDIATHYDVEEATTHNNAREEEDSDRGSHMHHHHHHHGDIAKVRGIKDLAWMIIAGDGLHNFSDGLAIGAAFSSSISAGLSTSLAIFCHELPHELGDFAVLIDAGMSIKKALLYNGLSACLAFLGAIIGLLIGEYTTSVKLWVLAITAGGFLYVGLVDMLPEMLKQCVEKDGFARFIYQNIGFISGVSIMLLIAWYEESFLLVFNVPHGH